MGNSEIVIEARDISKKYRLGSIGHTNLKDELTRLLRGKKRKEELPFSSQSRTENNDFWALRDINFDVRKGEILGIIGNNGAGKSTLLKILSSITSPTTGVVKIKGRVASLLEVGTGFHPELTGRENIFLNGTILGMTRAEIRLKLDEIIAFSGVEHHIDTPVKRYSSGMKVRLGFAVAAHLEPEILVIDEVLAVGDAEFQKKCLGKMQSVSLTGRTVLFVSHNMTAVRNLCTSAIWLQEGRIVFTGDTQSAVQKYLGGESGNRIYFKFSHPESQVAPEFLLNEIEVFAKGKKTGDPILMSDEVVIRISHERLNSQNRYDITLQFKGESGEILFSNGSGRMESPGYKNGSGLLEAVVPANLFNSGVIEVNMLLIENRRSVVYQKDSLISFTIVQNQKDTGSWMGRSKGDLYPLLNWNYYTHA